MKNTDLEIQQKFTVSYGFPIIFTHGAFTQQNRSLCRVVANSGQTLNRLLVLVDSGLAQANTKLVGQIQRYAAQHSDILQLVAAPYLVSGGELAKQDARELQKIHALVAQHHLCRHAFIVAIGGGAMLDVAGYAAATAHRGIRLIRMPTTTLAQNDAGIGVKNGINAFGRKNFLGTFTPPFGIIADFDFLKTLAARDCRAGMAEAVKVALIKDPDFFDYLYRHREQLAAFAPKIMEQMIVRCARLHLDHTGNSGDPFEFGSARPLDFGHWSAHKLEALTGGAIKHGEAVAIGIALDSLYSCRVGLITEQECDQIVTTLAAIGFDLSLPALGQLDCHAALDEFREHLGGELTITLLQGIGHKTEVHAMDAGLLQKCIETLAARKDKVLHWPT